MSKEDKFVLAPASEPQEQFLASDATITLFHGSAGGGKTFSIILSLVKYALMDNSTIVVFRRTSTQLRQNGGVWQESCQVFKRLFGKDVIIRNRDLEIYLPKSNSTIKFSHLQHQSDVNNHLGAQYSYIVFDEATLFPFEEMILPLMGRLRNANVKYTPRMAWCTNPMYNHGIYHWIKDFYIGEDGVPLPEKSNVKRYFVLQDGRPLWYATLEEAEEIHGKNVPRSFIAIRSHVTQNLPLLKANPDYISNLLALPDIKKRIFYDGSWTAREEEAGLFRRSWVTMVDTPNLKTQKRVLAFDQASTPVSSASPNPDWTRGVVMSKDKLGIYTIEHMVSIRDRPHVVQQLIFDTAREFPNVTVSLAVDPGSSGVAYAQSLRKELVEMGIHCVLVRANKSKRTRFLPFSAISEAGFVNVVQADWNEVMFNEMEEFSGLRSGERDDICDAVSDCVFVLNRETVLPEMQLPDYSGSSSPFGFAPSFGSQSMEFPTF